MNNPFVLSTDEYQRNVDPFGQAVDQYTQYLVQMTGKPYDECKAGVRKILKERRNGKMRDPKVTHFRRKDNGDREQVECGLSEYLYSSLADKDILAPTLTAYHHPSVKESLLVGYVDGNVAGRSAAKKLMFKAIARGDKSEAIYYDREQNNRKTRNNSLSGGQVSASTPICNKTAHSTLTTNCRSTSGYGNANNEKFLSGNRHYWGYDVVLNNITSIITTAEYQLIDPLIEKYRIHIPTPDEVMDCITYSTKLYWRNIEGMAKIRALVDTLTDIQRVVFTYCGDFYHFAKHNDVMAREIIEKLSTKTSLQIDNPVEFLMSADEVRLDYARAICRKEMRGIEKTKDAYNKLIGDERLNTVVGTLNNINNTIDEYSDFIRAFWTSPTVPASVAYFPRSIRRAALTSDTDSTIFTVQDWVRWFYRKPRVKAGSPVAVCMPFLAAQTITHLLAKMSANFGVVKERMYEIAMKNEYQFDVFVPTQVAKHYYATKNIQEGIILDPIDYEIKGVHLKNSNVPKAIIAQAQDMMKRIMTTVAEGEDIEILKYLKEVADVERDVMDKLAQGSILRNLELKPAETYKNGEKSPYQYHKVWKEVFAQKYGDYGEPPYTATRIATTLDNPTRFKYWVDNMKDRDLAARITAWSNRTGKRTLTSLLIPAEAIAINGIPQEILETMDIRKITRDLCNVFYIVLETLGYYIPVTTKAIHLVSDQH